MSSLGWPMGVEYLKKYIIIGDAGDSRKYRRFWWMEDDLNEAKRLAMAWLIAGFATRVIDLKVTAQGWGYDQPTVEYFAGPYKTVMPELADRYGNLQSVIDAAKAHGVEITKFSMQAHPPMVPSGMDDAAFFAWLKAQSLLTPTWPLPADPTVVKAQSIPVPMPEPEPRPVTSGVTHIAQAWGNEALCGCKGHTEPNLAFDVPLKHELAGTYCQECVRAKEQCHNDYMRGWSRSHYMYGPPEMMQPGEDEAAFRQRQEMIEAQKPKPVWEEP